MRAISDFCPPWADPAPCAGLGRATKVKARPSSDTTYESAWAGAAPRARALSPTRSLDQHGPRRAARPKRVHLACAPSTLWPRLACRNQNQYPHHHVSYHALRIKPRVGQIQNPTETSDRRWRSAPFAASVACVACRKRDRFLRTMRTKTLMRPPPSPKVIL